ncbi:MAG: AraC family transcriptional regulator [Clostridia bacterium]|nr:AraC family transcriptional regulator [Clostridia bacterium]
MRNILTEYISKNGIRFHHSVTTYEDGYRDTLAPETHQMCEVIFMLSGEVKYKIEGRYYHLSPLDAIIIHPNKLHSREVDFSQPYERMVLHFSPELLPSFADLNLLSGYNGSFLPSVLPRKIIEETELRDLMHKCEALCQTENPYKDLRFVGIILQIVEVLNEVISKLDERSAPVKVDKISHECIQYILRHLTEKDKLSPRHLANELHISVSHLQHTFKKELGITLHRYITDQKMQLARKLLLQGQTPQAVSDLLDYEYYSTFYHSFVKRFGSPPNALKGQ